MESVTQFITQKLRLKVNEAKSAVARPRERQFLGFSFSAGPEIKRVIAPKALDRFRRRVREITRRAKGVSMKTTIEELAPYMRGWRGYFGFCETPSSVVCRKGRTQSLSISTATDRCRSGRNNQPALLFDIQSNALETFEWASLDQHAGTRRQLRPWHQMKARAEHRLDRVDFPFWDSDWSLAGAQNRNHTGVVKIGSRNWASKLQNKYPGKRERSSSFERSDQLRVER